MAMGTASPIEANESLAVLKSYLEILVNIVMAASRFLTFDAHVPHGPLDEAIFRVAEEPLPALEVGQMLLRPLAFSLDPFQRSLLQGGRGYFLPYHVPGRPISGPGIARVVRSRNPQYEEGTLLSGWLDWAEWMIAPRPGDAVGLTMVDSAWGPPSHALHLYGITGLTAYFGIIAVGEVTEGQNVIISSAAGAVGTIAGQIAKLRGARVIGLTTGEDKRNMLTGRLGFDVALDYRSSDFVEQLTELVPSGPDVYFDNVGGSLSQTIMNLMRRPARIVECGQISTYNDENDSWMVDIMPIHRNGLRFEGFTPLLFADDWPRAISDLSRWAAEGHIEAVETVMEGLESLPHAIVSLLSGACIGKVVVTIAE